MIEASSQSLQPCIGCGLLVPNISGPTHAYIGASPGCWKIYGDVLAKEYGELRNPEFHRLSVDAYAVQHPGTESRRSIQSVGVHLIALHLVYERGLPPGMVTKRMSSMVKHAPDLLWLDPPSFAGTPSVRLVADANTPEQHEEAVHQWAQGVWAAWSAHHRTVATWSKSYD